MHFKGLKNDQIKNIQAKNVRISDTIKCLSESEGKMDDEEEEKDSSGENMKIEKEKWVKI